MSIEAGAAVGTDPRRTRVLLVTQNLFLCGAQRQLVELAVGLDPERYDVRVACLDDEGPLRRDLDQADIPVIRFPRRWRWDPSVATRLKSYLEQESIKIVHSFLFLPNFYSRLAGRLAGTPAIVSSLRGTGIEGAHRYAIDVWTAFLCDVIVANSQAGASEYLDRWGPPRRIVVIHNGIDLDRFRPLERDPGNDRFMDIPISRNTLGMFAAFEERKDQTTLVEAMASVVRQKPDTHLLLVGKGSSKERVRDQIERLGLGSSVTLRDEVQEIERLYSLLDVYVQASKSGEGTSNSILEAMASAVPVIATDVGGNKSLVKDGTTGLIVPPGDSASLASAVLSLLADPDTRKRMGKAGHQVVRSDYSRARMVADTQALYQSLLERA